MNNKLYRSINTPFRQDLDWYACWTGPDEGLIYCWELGRQKRLSEPFLAERAEQGELVTLGWKGGTENIDEPIDGKKIKSTKRYGSLKYLAMWQGLRGDDLDIDFHAERVIVCTRRKREVIFRALQKEQIQEKK